MRPGKHWPITARIRWPPTRAPRQASTAGKNGAGSYLKAVKLLLTLDTRHSTQGALNRRMFVRALLFLSVFISLLLRATEPPVIPVGLDAYRQWDRWACQRIGARAYMR